MNPSPRYRLKALLPLLPLLMLLALLLGAAPARAAGSITCSSASMTNLNFGTVNPLASQTDVTATLNYSCSNTDNKNTHSALLCFSIGEPGGRQTNPRLMSSGSNTLQFQLYQNANRTNVWGSQFFGSFLTPVQVPITLTKGTSTNNGQATLYGRVLGGQTGAIPGSYQDVYQNGDTALTINDAQGDTAPASCGGSQESVYFAFTVSAVVAKQCTVTAGANLNLGTVAPTATNVPGNTSIAVTCTNTTPYYIGLLPSNNNTAGTGVMSGTGGNASTVPYQLYQNAGLSTAWGNTATTTSAGNGMAGTGTGVAQSYSVYARAPSADFQPDTYTDTVVVNVNY
ncbi:MAG: spore coat U domain-containing protein [Burkholderiaceae bacterium]|nr:MAG: spore coat U domain-containing protein [Burkholderiaceae bacterium]